MVYHHFTHQKVALKDILRDFADEPNMSNPSPIWGTKL